MSIAKTVGNTTCHANFSKFSEPCRLVVAKTIARCRQSLFVRNYCPIINWIMAAAQAVHRCLFHNLACAFRISGIPTMADYHCSGTGNDTYSQFFWRCSTNSGRRASSGLNCACRWKCKQKKWLREIAFFPGAQAKKASGGHCGGFTLDTIDLWKSVGQGSNLKT